MEDKKDWTQLIEYMVGSLSIGGCIFILFVFFSYRKLRNFSFECVAYLTFSSMMNTISYMINYIDIEDKSKEINKDACEIQGFMMVLFENSQYIWAMLIAYYIHQSVIYFDENQGKNHLRTRIKFLCTGYLVPLIMALVALFRGVYGESGQWCWIDTTKDNWENKIFSFVLYCIVWLLIFFNFFFNYRVIKYLNREINSEREKQTLDRYYKKLMLYPIIQVICIFPGTINRFLEIFMDKQIYALQLTQMFFTLIQGFLYALVYGLTYQVRKALHGTYNYFCRCCLRNRSESLSSNSSQKMNERTYSNSSSDGSYLEQPSAIIRREV